MNNNTADTSVIHVERMRNPRLLRTVYMRRKCKDQLMLRHAREDLFWCERGDSNPHALRRQILSLVRLPIPPLSHWLKRVHVAQ